MHLINDQDSSILKALGTLDIGAAEELRAALSGLLNAVAVPGLDLSGVDACDTAALQLICSARKTAERSAKHLQLVGLPPAIIGAAAELGLVFQELPGVPPPVPSIPLEPARAV